MNNMLILCLVGISIPLSKSLVTWFRDKGEVFTKIHKKKRFSDWLTFVLGVFLLVMMPLKSLSFISGPTFGVIDVGLIACIILLGMIKLKAPSKITEKGIQLDVRFYKWEKIDRLNIIKENDDHCLVEVDTTFSSEKDHVVFSSKEWQTFKPMFLDKGVSITQF